MNFEEKTLDYEYVYKGKVIDVRRDNVEISTGRKSVREVVEHSGGVVIAAQKSPDTVLMVKQFRYPIKETVLELPAGKLEKAKNLFRLQKESWKRKPDIEQKFGKSWDLLIQVRVFAMKNYIFIWHLIWNLWVSIRMRAKLYNVLNLGLMRYSKKLKMVKLMTQRLFAV